MDRIAKINNYLFCFYFSSLRFNTINTFILYWPGVGRPSVTLLQHQYSIGCMYCVHLVYSLNYSHNTLVYCYREYGNHQFLKWLAIYYFISHVFPAIIGHLCSVCAVLNQRRRRCTALTLGQRCIGAVHMFCVCWVLSRHDALERWCFSAGPTSATLARHWSTIVSTCRVCWVTGL